MVVRVFFARIECAYLYRRKKSKNCRQNLAESRKTADFPEIIMVRLKLDKNVFGG
jgi:hypothetical protein